MDMITPCDTIRKRALNSPDKPQWRYHVLGGKVEVCRHTFMSVHGISDSKLRKSMELKRKLPENIACPDMQDKSKFCINIFKDMASI